MKQIAEEESAQKNDRGFINVISTEHEFLGQKNLCGNIPGEDWQTRGD